MWQVSYNEILGQQMILAVNVLNIAVELKLDGDGGLRKTLKKLSVHR